MSCPTPWVSWPNLGIMTALLPLGVATSGSMFMAGHLPHKFVAYPISGPAADGRCVVNWVAELDWRAHGISERESWNRLGDTADFLPRFLDWNFDWLDIPGLITSADAVYEFPMVDRDPVPTWTRGRVTLLGDAAHPMYPVGSNGASQGILDCMALANALRSRATVEDALLAYEQERLEPTAKLTLDNRETGPERVLQMVEDRCPNGFNDIYDHFGRAELEDIAQRYKKLAGFDRDALALAERSSPRGDP